MKNIRRRYSEEILERYIKTAEQRLALLEDTRRVQDSLDLIAEAVSDALSSHRVRVLLRTAGIDSVPEIPMTKHSQQK